MLPGLSHGGPRKRTQGACGKAQGDCVAGYYTVALQTYHQLIDESAQQQPYLFKYLWQLSRPEHDIMKNWPAVQTKFFKILRTNNTPEEFACALSIWLSSSAL
jgi:hypothetical protein